MNILIFGAGTIGIHISHILKSKKNNIYIYVRKKKSDLENYSINLKIKDNSKLISTHKITNEKNLFFINDIKIFKKIKLDYIFITAKITSSADQIFKKMNTIINKKTFIITPCTVLPNWWLEKYGDIKKFNNFIPTNKSICMTMWISGVKKGENITIKHTQRGYPIKEINIRGKTAASNLRKMILKKSKSPLIKNPYSEIYLKVINSFAFNLIAIKYNQNNNQLSKNKLAILDISLIMEEFDNIMIELGLEITQSVKSRISQTLSSKKHTMSMLNDFRLKKPVELNNQWKSLNKIKNISINKVTNSYKNFKFVMNKINDNNI